MQKIWIAILIIILIVFVGISAYLYGQNKAVQEFGAAKTTVEQEAANPLTNSQNEQTPVQVQPTPVVVFEAQGSIPPQDLTELQERIVAPFVDYKAEIQPGELVSLKISPNLLASKNEYPYLADAVFRNGGNEGFVISKGANGVNWYIPECMNGCEFSEAFKVKYPEIIELSN